MTPAADGIAGNTSYTLRVFLDQRHLYAEKVGESGVNFNCDFTADVCHWVRQVNRPAEPDEPPALRRGRRIRDAPVTYQHKALDRRLAED